MASEIELLRAENERLQALITGMERNNDLFLVLLAFIVAIFAACLVALRQELLRLWRQYEELMLMPEHKPEDRLLRMHDNFNLFVLPIVVILDIKFVMEGNLDHYDNPNFWRFLWFTSAYIFIDMVWVALFPKCVKSQTTILIHHAVTLLYMGIPAFNPATRYAMAACLSVELNTWFLILRRAPIARGALKPFASVPFYITWYVIRIGIYPYMIYDVWMLLVNHVEAMKQAGDPAYHRARYGLTYMAIPPVIQTLLTLLNFHWTIQLIRNNLKKKGPEKGL
eukprot:TRINITY_DN39699_c0_g1_i1.p1 TRINITY_DN39699_c0_g1~~TRINITY_DN39699_c0_g1_i1.p1  ORF type:complete len:303 (-),score=57.51 TRINITY_DN39699_c0_g1_i1:108-950(-)